MTKMDGDLLDEGPEFQASGWAKVANQELWSRELTWESGVLGK